MSYSTSYWKSHFPYAKFLDSCFKLGESLHSYSKYLHKKREQMAESRSKEVSTITKWTLPPIIPVCEESQLQPQYKELNKRLEDCDVFDPLFIENESFGVLEDTKLCNKWFSDIKVCHRCLYNTCI